MVSSTKSTKDFFSNVSVFKKNSNTGFNILKIITLTGVQHKKHCSLKKKKEHSSIQRTDTT